MDRTIINSSLELLQQHNLQYTETNFDKPWGGYVRLADASLQDFIALFFPHQQDTLQSSSLPLSPKLLLVAPHARLSWQYHHRRAELWTIIDQPVGVALSQTDTEPEPTVYTKEDSLEIGVTMRHRLIGLDTWGLVAEIWQHVDPSHPSNEDDIVRLADDYGR